MPGLPQRNIDTSSWGIKEWRSDRRWGACFLVGWTTLFAWIAVELFREHMWWGWWVNLVLITILGGGGFLLQVVGLIRTTAWLNKQKPTVRRTDDEQ